MAGVGISNSEIKKIVQSSASCYGCWNAAKMKFHMVWMYIYIQSK